MTGGGDMDMTDNGWDRPQGTQPTGDTLDGWPVTLTGVTETIVATQSPDGDWYQAALGVHAPGSDGPAGTTKGGQDGVSQRVGGRRDRGRMEDTATARTWPSQTRRHLEATGRAYVQFVTDPVAFVAGALDEYRTAAPILETAWAWTAVTATPIRGANTGTDSGTDHMATPGEDPETDSPTDWALTPEESGRCDQTVPVINRGQAAVIEACVAASRLSVPAYDETDCWEQIDRMESRVQRCGGPRERQAMAYLRALLPTEV